MFVIDPSRASPDMLSAVAAVAGAVVVKLLEYILNKKDPNKTALDELQIELDACRESNIQLRFEKQSLEFALTTADDTVNSDEYRIENLTIEIKNLQKKITDHIDDSANGSK